MVCSTSSFDRLRMTFAAQDDICLRMTFAAQGDNALVSGTSSFDRLRMTVGG